MADMLSGLKVLVTRPLEQARTLCGDIERAGGEVISFPAIEIVPTASQSWSALSFSEQSIIIFVSRNAVLHFVAAWQGDLAETVQLIAVGAGTAAEMRAAGLRVDGQPEREDSEGLLSLMSLYDVDSRPVWIVRGVGGRAYLATGLRELGAEVNYLEVYHRGLPEVSAAQCEAAARADCVMVTSVAGLDNLCRLLSKQLHTLQPLPLIVISERIAQHAVQCGFKHVIVSSGASDDEIMRALIALV